MREKNLGSKLIIFKPIKEEETFMKFPVGKILIGQKLHSLSKNGKIDKSTYLRKNAKEK